MAKKLVIWSFSLIIGVIIALSQNSVPSFLRFLNRPFHSFLFINVFQSSSYSKAEVNSDLSTRGFCPSASSLLYPVTLLNQGFTYWILPFSSVITIDKGECSIIFLSLCNSIRNSSDLVMST